MTMGFELNTRAFAWLFAHIPFIPVGRTKECQECVHILFQVGSTNLLLLTTDIKISPGVCFCSPAITVKKGSILK